MSALVGATLSSQICNSRAKPDVYAKDFDEENVLVRRHTPHIEKKAWMTRTGPLCPI
jgi:hypothetical protein